MVIKKKSLKSLRENQEHLPVHPSNAAAEVPDSLSAKDKKVVPAAQNGEDVAMKGGQHGDGEGDQIPEEKDDELEEMIGHDSARPVHASDAASTLPDDKSLNGMQKPLHTEEEEYEDGEKMEEYEDEYSDEMKDEAKLSEEEEKELEYEEEKELEEHIAALTEQDDEGEQLPESFKRKAATIFEAAVKTASKRRVDAYKKKLSEAYAKKLAAQKQSISESLVDKVDGYLDYVVEEWMEENEVAIETGLKTEIVEKFIVSLKETFEKHYIEVPADKADVLNELETKVKNLERELNESLNKNVQLRSNLILLEKEAVIKKLSEELTVSDASKFSDLCEGVSFENVKAFSEKLKVIKETYFPKAPKRKSDLGSDLLAEGGIEPQETEVKSKDDIDLAVDAISRLVKR